MILFLALCYIAYVLRNWLLAAAGLPLLLVSFLPHIEHAIIAQQSDEEHSKLDGELEDLNLSTSQRLNDLEQRLSQPVQLSNCNPIGNEDGPKEDYWNGWDAHFARSCPSPRVMVGVESYHDNGREDRRFRFKCCELSVATSD